MSEIHFSGGQGSIWIQPNGPATDMAYLGCHEVASISEPLGDYAPRFCPDPAKPSSWLTSGETSAPPEAVTAQVMEDILGQLSYLEYLKCPFPLYINMVCSGRKDVFTNYERTFILDTRKITNRTYDNIAMKETDEGSTITHDISAAPPLIKVVKVFAVRQSIPDYTGA